MEAYVQVFSRANKLESRIVRLPSVYGPHMRLDDDRLVTNMMQHILQNATPQLWGDVDRKRSFCFVKDLVWFLVKWMEEGGLEPTEPAVGVSNFSAKELVERLPNMLAGKEPTWPGMPETFEYFKESYGHIPKV